MSSAKRIGILGGTFDPPHIVHILMAEEAVNKIPLEKVLFMPAPNPPHKTSELETPYYLRLRMVELAIAGHPSLELSRMEEFRNGPSFTIDLLKHYRERYDDDLFFIIGADTLSDLPNWKDPEGVLKLATLVVFPRTGFPPILPIHGNASIVLFEAPIIDISSSDIRVKLAKGESVAEFLPKGVQNFILDNSLYVQ